MLGIEKHAELIRDLIDGEVRIHESMKKHTTFRIGGTADILALPASVEDIIQIIDYAKTSGVQYYVIGNGSNLLVADSGVRGIVIKIGKGMSGVEFDGDVVKAQAGTLLSSLSKMAVEHELSGLEYGIGIPGTLGGAVVMNAGSDGQDISQILTSVKVLNVKNEPVNVEKTALEFGYRNSRLKRSGEIVLEAELQLRREKRIVIRERMKNSMAKRRATMPLKYPSVGSIFKNPEGDSAGRLIDQAGCKGMRKGDAQVSELHANWIVNLGNAKAADVLDLVSQIQEIVQTKNGLRLNLEVVVLQ